jgi:hypothetical protein
VSLVTRFPGSGANSTLRSIRRQDGRRPAVFDDIPITAIVTMETVGTGTRYVFTALHRDEAAFEKNKASGWQQGTEIALDQFVAHVKSMK